MNRPASPGQGAAPVAPPFGKLHEMFLFRPYDKATIWEQQNVARFAVETGADVLLWECMALTDSYVRQLQHHPIEWLQTGIQQVQRKAGRDAVNLGIGVGLAAIDKSHVKPDAAIAGAREIAFFPPMTGG